MLYYKIICGISQNESLKKSLMRIMMKMKKTKWLLLYKIWQMSKMKIHARVAFSV